MLLHIVQIMKCAIIYKRVYATKSLHYFYCYSFCGARTCILAPLFLTVGRTFLRIALENFGNSIIERFLPMSDENKPILEEKDIQIYKIYETICTQAVLHNTPSVLQNSSLVHVQLSNKNIVFASHLFEVRYKCSLGMI